MNKLIEDSLKEFQEEESLSEIKTMNKILNLAKRLFGSEYISELEYVRGGYLKIPNSDLSLFPSKTMEGFYLIQMKDVTTLDYYMPERLVRSKRDLGRTILELKTCSIDELKFPEAKLLNESSNIIEDFRKNCERVFEIIGIKNNE